MTALAMKTHTLDIPAQDRAALARMHAVDPVWRGMALARDVIAFDDARTILHAGPPVQSGNIAEPLLNSMVAAALFEGWTGGVASAREMIANGDIRLVPAQDRSAMVPLAAVLSPNMMVNVVCDANDPDNRVFSPINGGSAYEARFGLGGEKPLAYLRWVNGNLGATLAIIADRDIRLLPIVDAALARGDDGHGRTAKASEGIVAALAPRLGVDTLERRFLDVAPGFFLTLWMAACKCIARAGEGEGSSIITALGGNGIDVGVQVGAMPGRWWVRPAAPPDGALEAGFAPDDRLGAIGDSALVDALGFGAMLPSVNPEGNRLLPLLHPAFQAFPLAVGSTVRAIRSEGPSLTIALGILDRSGRKGRIGGGLYRAPHQLFNDAASHISATHSNEGVGS